MSFKSLLNTVCDIELISLSVSAQGEQQESYTKLYTSVPCRLRARSVWERRYSDPAYQKSTHSLYLESLNITAGKVRIVMENVPYNVVGVTDMGGAGRYQCLYLERIINA